MRFEVESKFRVPDPEPVRARLAGLGGAGAPGPPEVQIDRYHAHPARDFRKTGEAFRLRRSGSRNLLTYKGPRLPGGPRTRREIEVDLAPGAAAADRCGDLLAALGFASVAEVRKRRSEARATWEGRPISLAFDEVDGLGSFVELEILCDGEGLAEAQEALERLGAALGLGSPEPRTYLEMLLERTPDG
jgi:adenylate cyclase class 2